MQLKELELFFRFMFHKLNLQRVSGAGIAPEWNHSERPMSIQHERNVFVPTFFHPNILSGTMNEIFSPIFLCLHWLHTIFSLVRNWIATWGIVPLIIAPSPSAQS